MKKITDTSKTERIDWLFGANPSAIYAQEEQGQKELVISCQLPAKCNGSLPISIQEQYNKMGIQTPNVAADDELFIEAILPDGWRKEATDHSMWSNLIDDKGRKRASIFYKAAFYDRDAFINFENRYIQTHEYVDLKSLNSYDKYYCVKDNATGTIIFKTEITKEYSNDDLRTQCTIFIEDNFPNHEDLNAYWD